MTEEHAPPIEIVTPNQIVASNLHRLRVARGWSQADLAHQFERVGFPGWTVTVISDAENARFSQSAKEREGIGPRAKRQRNFTIDDLIAIARVFHVSALTLLIPDVGLHVHFGNAIGSRRAYTWIALHMELDDATSADDLAAMMLDRFAEDSKQRRRREALYAIDRLKDRLREHGGDAVLSEFEDLAQPGQDKTQINGAQFELIRRLRDERGWPI